MGIYTDYEGRETEDYSVLAACEVEKKEGQPNGITIKSYRGEPMRNLLQREKVRRQLQKCGSSCGI